MATPIRDSGDSCLTVLSQEKVVAFSVRNFPPMSCQVPDCPISYSLYKSHDNETYDFSRSYRVRGRHIDLHGPGTSGTGGV